MKTALLGARGYWGQKIEKRLRENNFYELIATIDPHGGDFSFWEDFKKSDLFDQTELVCIFTPPDSHTHLTEDSIKNNKHVICAKPFVSSEREVAALYDLAKKNNVALLLDYTFAHNSAIHKLKELLPLIGAPKLLVSRRMNFGKYQDFGTITDLLPHDISIANFLFGDLSGKAYVSQNSAIYKQDFAHVFIKNGSPDLDLTFSWSCPIKDRELFVVGELGILRVGWDKNQIELTKIEKHQIVETRCFIYENKDALDTEFKVFSSAFVNNSFSVIMNKQQITSELMCKFIEACK